MSTQKTSESINERIAERMQQAREEARGGKGYTQQELANLLDVSPITLSRWENAARHPSFQMLEKFAEAVGKPLAFFFEKEPQEDNFAAALLRATSELSEEDKQDVLDYANFRYQQWYERQQQEEK